MGAVLVVGGGWLIALGGSPFFLIAGILAAAAGVCLFRGSIYATWIALALLVIAAVWSYADIGFTFWPFFSRIMVFLGIALVTVMFAPWLSGPGASALSGKKAASGSVVLGIAMVAMLAGMFSSHATLEGDGAALKILGDAAPATATNDWTGYGRTTSGSRFAPFQQINADNVKNLKVAWTYRTGDLAIDSAEFQMTPLKVGNTVYVCSPYSKVSAVDAATGKLRWKFDPHAHQKSWQRCRGVAYAKTPTANPADPCQERVVLTTIDARLITIDAKTGKACEGFGSGTSVDLMAGMGPSGPGSYYPTSAPLVADDVVVVGGHVNDNEKTGEPSGVVRGYDVRTGAQRWAWDPTHPKGRTTPLAKGEIYTPETPNFWGTASFDPKLGLIYVPTGNQTPDFWGGNRLPESDAYTDSIVAIDVKTGAARWHFRTANHDLYDYDVAAQPILYDMPDGKGGKTPVVVALTKRGEIFVLDRRNGKPVIPVTNRKVPTDGAPQGQRLAPTQPFSALSLDTDRIKESDMWGGTIFDQMACRIAFKSMHYEGPFTPVGFKKTLIYPGYYGGFNWGGGAIDERTGTLYVNDIRMPQWGRFVHREDAHIRGLKPTTEGEYSEQKGTPYGVERSMFLSPTGVPCIAPPYGSMAAIDLTTGKKRWQVPAGSLEDSPAKPSIHIPLGLPTLGGPLVTAGGLTFFSGTMDSYLRAFDNRSGKVVWQGRLPVGSQAAPMTYMQNGKQYIVVTAGGQTRTGTNENRGDYVIAYSL
ncbi:dehydrogenase [Novosphingobium guangzhouense]|uniref:Dehydrogenase n=2 Tax=Novosphingobium guangzhouense TaxID=1850347 RepID=A0A2K2G6F1_9SPHN|nr:dehydrogenase [Novosphingobium guangzhouense]